MSRRKSSETRLQQALMLALQGAVLGAPGLAHAYVGPGAGLAMTGSLVAVILAAVIVLIGLVLFPLRVLMKKIRSSKVELSTGDSGPPGSGVP